MMPALLTRIVGGPRADLAASNAFVASPGFPRSTGKVATRRPAARAASAAAPQSPRASSATSAPASARPMAIAAPKPREAPVTRATWPSRRNEGVTEAMTSTQVTHRDRIHVREFLILATHAPHEHVRRRADTGVDRPGR